MGFFPTNMARLNLHVCIFIRRMLFDLCFDCGALIVKPVATLVLLAVVAHGFLCLLIPGQRGRSVRSAAPGCRVAYSKDRRGKTKGVLEKKTKKKWSGPRKLVSDPDPRNNEVNFQAPSALASKKNQSSKKKTLKNRGEIMLRYPLFRGFGKRTSTRLF